jgi:hypothetical protein
MKTAIALTLGLFLAIPAFAATLDVGPADVPQIPWPSQAGDTDCASNQGAVINAQLGIQGSFGPQGACLAGGPGTPGNLIGLGFPVASCQDGFLKTTNIQFNIADATDMFHLYIWREQGGLPIDTCGLECGVAAGNPLQVGAVGPTVRSFSWIPQQCPCLTFTSERLWIGAVYVNGVTPPDWFIGRENSPFGAGFGYGNLTGNHGDWQDLNNFGFGNHWGVENIISTECGQVAVEPATWGVVKSLYE